VYLWDNLWFAGQYPLVSYSLLYYPVAAVTGNLALVMGSVIASAVLFERICSREWGEAAVWPSRAFAVLAAGPLFTGTYSYAAGFATLLATLAALQSGRISIAVGCGAMTLGFSPLAFVFLVLVLAAVAVSRRSIGRKAAAFGVGLTVAAGVELAALRLFPTGGRYPFRGIELATVLVVAGIGLLIASRAPNGGVLAALFGFWLLASIVLFLVPEPVGENVTRLRSVVFPLMLLTVMLARFKPRVLVVLGLTVALAYNVVPYANAVASRMDTRASNELFWAPALAYLRVHNPPDYRVEVVPTADHWEAYWVPRANFALARGWYRQLDIAENRVLYRDPLSAGGYRLWLRRMAVRYVLLPNIRLGKKGASREARLLQSGAVPGLTLVFRTPDWRIYELTDARPMLTGPGTASINAFKHDRIAGKVAKPGTYRLAVRYMPYWEVKRGAVCVAKALNGMTLVEVQQPGRFLLATEDGPASLVRSPLRDDGSCK
jgi:MFS family permease